MPLQFQISLYRLYDANGTLLYVGIAENPKTRWKQHARAAPWWPLVDETRSRVEWHSSRADAEAAEKAAILAEDPVHNIVWSPRRTFAPRPKVTEISGFKAMSVQDLRASLKERMEAAMYLDEPTIVTKHGKPRAVLISQESYDVLVEIGIAPPADS